MNQVLSEIESYGIIPAVSVTDAKKAVPLADALSKGSIPVVEITFSTDCAAEAVHSIVREIPEIIVGAGEILTRQKVDDALAAGAQFLTSPQFQPELVEYALSKGALMIPGVSIPGEIEQAMALGLEAVKFFPAHAENGVAMLKALAGPYKRLNWIPSGEINTGNLNDYLAIPQVIACGVSWDANEKLICTDNWAEVTRWTIEVVRTVLGISLGHVGVNCNNAEESKSLAEQLCAMFGLECQKCDISNFAGSFVECMNQPGRGRNGHIGFFTNHLERTVAFLRQRGIEIDETTRQRDTRGCTKLVYLAKEYGGFALHIIQK